MVGVAGFSRSAVSEYREPYLLEGSTVPFPSEKIAQGIASGFVNEAIDSFRSLFSWQGAAFATGITFISSYLPRAATAGLYVGIGSGIWQMGKGVISFLKRDTEFSPEQSAAQIGKGLFYTLPLSRFLMVRTQRSIVRWNAVKEMKRTDGLIPEDGQLEALAAQISDGPTRRMLQPLPPNVRRKIWKAIEEPKFSREHSFSLAESSLPLSIDVTYQYRNPKWKVLHPLTEVILSLDKLHEGRHLRAGYERYPDFWRYCVERRVKDDIPTGGDLLKQFFARHIDRRRTVREAVSSLWSRDRKKVWQALRFWGLQRVRPEERLCFAEEYRAIRAHLDGFDWMGTLNKYWGIYLGERGEVNWLRRFQDWRVLKQLRRSVAHNFAVPLAVSESQYLRFRTITYEHFNFFGYTEQDLAQGLYLYFCLNDRGVRLQS